MKSGCVPAHALVPHAAAHHVDDDVDTLAVRQLLDLTAHVLAAVVDRLPGTLSLRQSTLLVTSARRDHLMEERCTIKKLLLMTVFLVHKLLDSE